MKKQTITILSILSLIASTTQINAQSVEILEQNQTTVGERNPIATMPAKPPIVSNGNNGNVNAFCASILSLNIVDKSSSNIILGWASNGNFASITIRYALSGSTNWRNVTIAGNPNPSQYVITGLNSTTTYDIQISTTCLTGLVSQWTHPITVTTFDAPAPRLAQIRNNTRININPNPASLSTIVSYHVPAGTVSQLVVVNLSGREVFKTQIVSTEDKTQYTLDVSDFAPGLYFVRLSNRNGISSERLTKL
jgi:hypothetical protein